MANSKSDISGKTRVFISYSRKDQTAIDRLYEELNADKAHEVFLDAHDILPSEEWKPRLEGLIRSADTFLFALSADSLGSEICQWELEFANSLNKRIIPVVLQDLGSDTPEIIARLNYIFLDEDHEFAQTIANINAAIDLDIDWVREHTRIGDLSNRWEKAKELNIQPLRGKELDAAENWLATQPKNAPFPTPSQRQYIYDSRKHATKRQRIMVAGSLIALLVVGLLGVFAFVQRNAAVEGERKAQAALAAGTRAANTLVFDLANELATSPVPSSLIESILDKARTLQEELGENFPDDLELQRSKANALSALGDIYLVIKDTAQASIAFEESLNIYFEMVELEPNNTLWWQDVSIGLGKVSNVKAIVGDVPGAVSALEDSLLVTNDLLAFDANNSDWQRDRAVSLNKISRLYLFIGDVEKQIDALTQSAQTFRNLVDLAPNELSRRYDLSVGLSDFAEATMDTDLEGARKLFEEVLTISQELAETDPDNTLWQRGHATSLDKIANMDLQNGKTEEALLNYEKSLQITRELLEIDPQNTRWQADVAIALNKTGHANRQSENYDIALSIYQEVLSIRRDLAAKDENKLVWQRGVSDSLDQIGEVKQQMNDLAGALVAFQESLAIRRKIELTAPESLEWKQDIASSLYKSGTILQEQKNYAQAIEVLEESLDIVRVFEQNEPDDLGWQTVIWQTLEQLSSIKLAQEDEKGTIEIYEELLKSSRTIANLDQEAVYASQQISFLLDQIGLYYYNLEDFEPAYENFRNLLDHVISMQTKFPNDTDLINDREYARVKTAEVAGRVARVQMTQLKFSDAETNLREAIALDPEPLWMKNMLAFALVGQDKLDEADQIFLQYRGQKMSSGRTWDEVVLNTIDYFKEQGSAHPHMAEIEKIFEQ